MKFVVVYNLGDGHLDPAGRKGESISMAMDAAAPCAAQDVRQKIILSRTLWFLVSARRLSPDWYEILVRLRGRRRRRTNVQQTDMGAEWGLPAAGSHQEQSRCCESGVVVHHERHSCPPLCKTSSHPLKEARKRISTLNVSDMQGRACLPFVISFTTNPPPTLIEDYEMCQFSNRADEALNSGELRAEIRRT